MLPKMGASYVIKKFADEMMAEPKAAVESAVSTALDPTYGSPSGARVAAPQNEQPDEWDGQTIANEEGEVIGTARRMREVSIYLVSDTYGDHRAELEACINDAESRRFLVHDEKGRLAGLIYAPHPDRMPARPDVIRAEDI